MLREITARRMSRLPPHTYTETGSPSWHSDDAIGAAKGALDEGLGSGLVDGIGDTLEIPPAPEPILKIEKNKGGVKVSTPVKASKLMGKLAGMLKDLVSTPIPSPLVEVPPIPIEFPTPKPTLPSTPVDQIPNKFTGWRRDVYGVVNELKQYANFEPLIAEPWVIFAIALAESGSLKTYEASPNAVNKSDGFYKDWGRTVSSVGLFQIREPTAYYLRKNRKRIGVYGASMLPTLPSNPAKNQSQVVKALKRYPEQIYLAMVLAALGMGWIRDSFTIGPEGRVAAVVNAADKDLMEYVNATHSDATPSWGALLRLYWAASSKAGPRKMVKTGAAKRIVHKRWVPFAKEEFDRVTKLIAS
jgi:hypothetical protein